jgi:NADH-quinone oxidoreductase subunit E/NADP-reducing hydrogenase subunit HndA
MICEKNKKEILNIINKRKNMETPLMMILSDIQNKYGYIDLEVQQIVADELNIPVSEVYGVVTFYSYFSLQPKGKYVIGICMGTACYVKGSQSLLDAFCNRLGIKEGQTTEDGLFTIDVLRCIGACGLAPVVSVNGKIYPHVSIKDVDKIIDECKKGEIINEKIK